MLKGSEPCLNFLFYLVFLTPLWHGEGSLSCFCLMEVEVLFPYLAFIDRWEQSLFVIAEWGWKFLLSRWFLQTPQQDGLITVGWSGKSRVSTRPPLMPPQWKSFWVSCYSLAGVEAWLNGPLLTWPRMESQHFLGCLVDESDYCLKNVSILQGLISLGPLTRNSRLLLGLLIGISGLVATSARGLSYLRQKESPESVSVDCSLGPKVLSQSAFLFSF